MADIGVCSECGNPRVIDAPCDECGDKGQAWSLI